GLGAPLYDLPDAGCIEFSSGAPSGNIAVTTAPEGWEPSTSTTVVFNTADCYAACAELRARGVRCDDPVVFPGYVVYCNFYDPFGNRLQMCSPAPCKSLQNVLIWRALPHHINVHCCQVSGLRGGPSCTQACSAGAMPCTRAA